MSQSRINRRTFLKKICAGVGAISFGKRVLNAKENDGVLRRIIEIEKSLAQKKGLSTKHPSSARAVIESIPDIASKEIALIKQHGERGKLYDISVERDTRSVKYPVNIADKASSFIHQHSYGVMTKGEMHYAYPGVFPDMVHHLETVIRTGKSQVRHMVTVNEKGKVMGYLSVNLTKKLILDKTKLNEFYSKIKELAKRIEDPYEGQRVMKEYINLLWEMKRIGLMQIKVHAMPKTKDTPAYEFNGITFVEKKK